MTRASALWLRVVLPLALVGCGAGWRRLDDLAPRTLPVRAQVQIWEGKRVRLLHAVTIDAEAIRGVPFTEPAECDSCRVCLALNAVDSLRVGNKEQGFVRSVELFVAVSAVWAFVFRGVGGD